MLHRTHYLTIVEMKKKSIILHFAWFSLSLSSYNCVFINFLCVFFSSEFAKNAKRGINIYKIVNNFEINRQKH